MAELGWGEGSEGAEQNNPALSHDQFKATGAEMLTAECPDGTDWTGVVAL